MWPTLHRAPWGQIQAAVLTPQRTCCLQGALTEQKKPYGSACDKLKCVKWLFSGVERSKDNFVGRQDGGVEGALLGPAVHNDLPGLPEVKESGLTFLILLQLTVSVQSV